MSVTGNGSTSIKVEHKDQRTDQGWTQAAQITGMMANATAIALAILSWQTADKMAKRQTDIANKQYQLSKELQDIWKSIYVPCEKNIAQEACGLPKYTPQYDRTAARYAAAAKVAYDAARSALRCVPRYCTGLTARMFADLAIAEANKVADTMALAYRKEEQRSDNERAIRWNMILNVLNNGRNIGQSAIQMANSAGAIYSSIGANAAGAFNDAVGFLGYNQRGNPFGILTGGQTQASATQQPAQFNAVPVPTAKPQIASRIPVPTPKPQQITSAATEGGSSFAQSETQSLTSSPTAAAGALGALFWGSPANVQQASQNAVAAGQSGS